MGSVGCPGVVVPVVGAVVEVVSEVVVVVVVVVVPWQQASSVQSVVQ